MRLFHRWDCCQAAKDIVWLNFIVWLWSKCRKTGIEKKFVAEGCMRRKTWQGFENIFIMKGSSVMHLAMVPRVIWMRDIFHHLLKCFKIADLLYTHYLLFYSLWWERIFLLFCTQHCFLLFIAMYNGLTGGVHLRGGGVWERCGNQTAGVLEAAETTGKKNMGQNILEKSLQTVTDASRDW